MRPGIFAPPGGHPSGAATAARGHTAGELAERTGSGLVAHRSAD